MKKRETKRQRKGNKAAAIKDLKPRRDADMKGGPAYITKSATITHIGK